MPDRSPATDRGNRAETADGGYFASLAQGRYLLVTTFRPKGAPVSARVQGVVEGDRAWFRVRSRSGTDRYLHGTDRVQVTPCDALGLVSYGPPQFAAVRPLAGEEASWADEKLDLRYPVKRGLLARLLRLTWVQYELAVP